MQVRRRQQRAQDSHRDYQALRATQPERGRDGNAEVVKSDAGGATYVAAYVYPLGAQPNAEAESAVRELCLKS